MEIVVRATVIYWFLWLIVRGTGKRSLSEPTPLEMVLIVVLGDLVQQGVTQEDMSVTGAVVAVCVFVLSTGRRSRSRQSSVSRYALSVSGWICVSDTVVNLHVSPSHTALQTNGPRRSVGSDSADDALCNLCSFTL